ncbi:hypothetical protein [Scytonema sp. NUACC26]
MQTAFLIACIPLDYKTLQRGVQVARVSREIELYPTEPKCNTA